MANVFEHQEHTGSAPDSPMANTRSTGGVDHMNGILDGGSSSKSSTPIKQPAIAAVPMTTSVAAEDLSVASTSSTSSGVKVGLAVVHTEDKSEELTEAILAALALYGAVPKVCKVSSALQLPAAHMQMAKAGHCDVVVAIFAMEGPMAHMMVPSVVSGLMQKAAVSGIPCVHGLYHPSDVDAAAVAKMWTEDVASLTQLHRATTPNGPADGGGNVSSATLGASKTPEEAIAAGVPPIVAESMSTFRESLKQHGAKGIFGLGRKFKIADDDGSGNLSVAEFSKVINEHRLGWNTTTIKAVFDFFDDDQSGTISYDEFLLGVRGELNERRKDMVMMAYQVLDKDKNGTIDLSDISKSAFFTRFQGA